MKANSSFIVLFALFISATGFAAENAANEPIVIGGTKFTYPLIEKWISEYQKVNPKITIKLAVQSNESQTANLNIIAHQPKHNELQPNQEIVYVGQYALLPVTNANNPVFISARKGLTKKEIDNLFFDVVDYDAESTNKKPKYQATIYARDNKSYSSNTLANYFGRQASEIRGKKVFGDDIYLLSAIKNDSLGLTYNNLGYLYDTNTRKLKEGIMLLPLDLKRGTKEILTGDLDLVISILENNKIETIPVENIGFVYAKVNENLAVSDFLKWVLTEGQQFNNEKGFLNLDNQTLAEQANKLIERFLTAK
jgi:phosphate transport system substrate-binding protein